MKELIQGLKFVLQHEVKNIFQYDKTEINIMLSNNADLDGVYMKTEEHVHHLSSPYTIAKINFTSKNEQTLKVLSLIQ